ncbi:MAG: CoA-binding protein [Deltaproteobacteria bacterium]|nr:CoA-binding protein [Deltaproteobacteria bacterium]
MQTWKPIEEFLEQKRIALVGASRNPDDFSRLVMKELQSSGYEVVPVHPEASEVAGLPAFPSVDKVDPKPDAALVMVPAKASADVVRACGIAGVRHVWLHRATGQGAVSDEAVREAEALGLSLVAGECPLMFLPNTKWFHRVHRFVKRIGGSLPKPEANPRPQA